MTQWNMQDSVQESEGEEISISKNESKADRLAGDTIESTGLTPDDLPFDPVSLDCLTFIDAESR